MTRHRKPRRNSARRGRRLDVATVQELEPRLLLSTASWTGGGDGTHWSDSLNWSGDALPGPSDDVVISVAGTPTIRFDASAGSVTVNSLLSDEALVLSGGSLDVTGNVRVNNVFTLSGGTLAGADVLQGSAGSVVFSGSVLLQGVTIDSNLQAASATLTATGGQDTSINGTLTLSGATLAASGSGSTLTVSAQTSLANTTVSADNGAAVTFSAVSALTIVSLYADSGATISFPAVTSDGVSGSDIVEADGSGSRIDLSNLHTMSGGGGQINIMAVDGGEVDLGGSISRAVLTVDSSSSTLNVEGVTSLANATVAAAGGAAVTFSSLTSLTIVNLYTDSGATISFPVVTSDGVSGSDVILAEGAGSRIDLSNLHTMSGSGGRINIMAADDGEVDLGGSVSDAFLTEDGTGVLGLAGITSLSGAMLSATDGAILVLPSGWEPSWGSGCMLTTSGAGSEIINQTVLDPLNVALTISSDAFVNEGTLDPQGSGAIDISGSLSIDDPGILTGAGTIAVTGDLLGDTLNADSFAPSATVLFDGSGTSTTPQQFEAFSQDLGSAAAGLVNNFAYGTVALAGDTYVKLVDLSDNAAGSDPEALYADSLIVPAGATLDLNGLHVYVQSSQILGTVLDGAVTEIDGGAITGHVSSHEDGSPLADVEIDALLDNNSANPSITAWTDSSGNYTIPDLQAGSYHVWANISDVSVGGKYYLQEDLTSVTVAQGATTSGQDFDLHQAGILYGYVYDPLGQPEVGAQVVAVGAGQENGQDWHYAYTDSNGRYEIDDLAATDQKFYPVKIVEAPVAGSPDQYYVVQIAPDLYAAQLTGTHGPDFHLSQIGGTIHGQVLLDNGQPAAYMENVLEPYMQISGGTFRDPSCYTDLNGEFWLYGVPPGQDLYLDTCNVSSSVLGSGYNWGQERIGPFNVQSGQTLDVPALTIHRSGSVGGVVRDADGNPVAGARVQVYGYDTAGGTIDLSSNDGDVYTDVQGNFLFTNVPAGRVWIDVKTDGFLEYHSAWVGVVGGHETSQDIALAPASQGGTVSGTIADFADLVPKNSDGVPLPTSLVDSYDDFGRSDGLGVVAFSSSMVWTLQQWLDIDYFSNGEVDASDGYTDYFDPSAQPAGSFQTTLSAGEKTVMGWYDLGGTTSQGDCTLISDPQDIDVAQGGSQNISIAFSVGTASISGTISLPGGYVLSGDGVKVYLRQTGTGAVRAGGDAAPDGQYRLYDLPAGQYYLYACAPGLGPWISSSFTVGDAQVLTQDITLSYGAAAGGVVTSDGQPVAGAVVTSQATGQSAQTDALGRYTLTGLVQGADTLSVSKPNFVSQSAGVQLTNGQETAAGFNLAQAIPPDAYEPDDTPDQANPITFGGASQLHSINMPGDVDWVTFTLSAAAAVTIQTLPAPADPTGGAGDDTALWLYASDKTTLIAFNDDGGVGQFSMIQRRGIGELPAGTYYVKVAAAGALGTIPDYLLSVGPVDTTAPDISNLTTQPDGTVIVDFSRPMLADNVDNGRDFIVTSQASGQAVAGTLRWAKNDTRMIWQPALPVAAGDTWQLFMAAADSSGFVDTSWDILAGGDVTADWGVSPGDTTPPIVLSFFGQTDGSLRVVFDEPMTTMGLNPDAVVVTDSSGSAVNGTVSWSADATSLSWTPATAPAAGDAWTLALAAATVGDIADAAGNPLDGNADGDGGDAYSVSWVVGSDIAPTATFKGTPDGTVTIDFSQPMQAAAVQEGLNVWVVDPADPLHQIAGQIAWNDDDTQLTWQSNLAPSAEANWQITLRAQNPGDFAGATGVLLDGDSDGRPGGDLVQSWAVGPQAAIAMLAQAFQSAPDGTATFDFSSRVLTSLVDPDVDVIVTDSLGQRVSGTLSWSHDDHRLTWTPDSPPTQGDQWTIQLGAADPQMFVDVAMNALDVASGQGGTAVVRQWNVAGNAAPSGVILPDQFQGANNTVGTAAPLDVSAGATSFQGLTLYMATDVEWFVFSTGATGAASDRVFVDADIRGTSLSLSLCDAAGNVLRTGAVEADADITGAIRTVVSLDGLPAGAYTLRVSGDPGVAGGLCPGYDLTVQPPKTVSQDTWTILYYINGDNNLDEGYYEELDQMEKLDLPSNVTVAVEYSRMPGIASAWQGTITDDWSGTRRGILSYDDTPNQLGSWLGPSTALPLQQRDMGDADTLGNFIAWAMAQAPATHYVLNIVDHGDGSSGVSFDQPSGKYLSPADISQALDGYHFDVLTMDTCLTGMAEVATAVAPDADYLVASEEASYTGVMTSQLGLLESPADWTARSLADGMAHVTAELHPQQNQAFGHDFYTTESVIDLGGVAAMNQALAGFVQAADEAGAPAMSGAAEQWTHIDSAIAASTVFLNETSRDLGQFLQNVCSDTVIAASTRAAAQNALAALESAVASNYSNGANATGLAVTLPFSVSEQCAGYGDFASAFISATHWDVLLNDVDVSVTGRNFSSDWAEPNNWQDQAYSLRSLQGAVTLPTLTIDSPGDRDFFLIELPAGGDANSYVRVQAVNGSGAPDTSWAPTISIYQATGEGAPVDVTGTSGLATDSMDGLPAGLYYVLVEASGGACGAYNMTIAVPPAASATDWAGDNHTRQYAYNLHLVPGAIQPYVGLVASQPDDWFSMNLGNLTCGPDGYIHVASTDGNALTVRIYDGAGGLLMDATGPQVAFDIPQDTSGQIYIDISGATPTTYAMTVKAPSYQIYMSAADDASPTSGITLLPAFSQPTFTVSWSGQDSGSGIAGYDVYVSDNGGAATEWQTGTADTSAVFNGIDGHTYSFTVLAIDNADNEQSQASAAVATTVDDTAPTSVLGASGNEGRIQLAWSGQDNAGGSGVADYTIFVSVDGGSYQPFLSNTTATMATYVSGPNHTYAFYCVATDNAGNAEAAPASPDATVTTWSTESKTLQKGSTSWSFTDSDGTPVTLTYTGSGQAVVERWKDTTGRGDIRNVTVTGDSGTGTLTITTTGTGQAGVTSLENINVQSSFGTITAKTTSLLGGVTIDGTLGALAMGSTFTGSSVSIGLLAKSTVKPALTFDQVQDLTITSLTPIGSITCTDWLNDTGLADAIQAPSLGTLTVAGKAANAALHQSAISGDFQASLTLQGVAGSTLPTLGSASIAGALAAGTWSINGKSGAITVGGAVSNWTLKGLDAGDPLTAVTSLTTGAVANTTINSTGYLGAIKALSWSGGSITATGTAGITTTGGDFNAGLTLSGVGVASTAKTLGPVKSAGAIDGTWSVTGATGTVAAVSIPATWSGTFSGNITSLTVTHNDSGQLKAGSLSGLTINGNLAGTIQLTGQAGVAQTLGTTKVVGTVTGNPWQIGGNVGGVTVGNVTNWGIQGYNDGLGHAAALGSISSLTAGTVANTTINSAGFLGAIKAVSWIGGSIMATGTTGITTTGGDFNAGLSLSGVGVAATAKTLGLVNSFGDIDGTWSVTGAAGALTAASIPTTWNGTFSGNIASLTVNHNAYGKLQAASVTTMTVKGNYGDGAGGDTTLNLTMPLSGTKTALGTLNVTGSMNTVAVTALANLGTITDSGAVVGTTINSPGFLGAIKALSWTGGGITAAGTTGITTTGGNFNAAMTLSGAGVAPTAKTLGSLSSAGTFDGAWSVTGASGALTAGSIPTTWNGTFSGNIASLTVAHNAYGQLKAGSVTTMTVKGNYGDGTSGDTSLKLTEALDTKTALGTLNVTGWMQGVNIASLDSLGSITAGGMNGSNVYAGVLDVDAALTAIGNIDHTVLSQAGIAGVTVKGMTGIADSYLNTDLAAWNMGTLKLNTIQVSNSGTSFGVAAHTIKSYTAQIGAKPYTWTPSSGVWPDDTTAGNGDYECLYVV